MSRNDDHTEWNLSYYLYHQNYYNPSASTYHDKQMQLFLNNVFYHLQAAKNYSKLFFRFINPFRTQTAIISKIKTTSKGSLELTSRINLGRRDMCAELLTLDTAQKPPPPPSPVIPPPTHTHWKGLNINNGITKNTEFIKWSKPF